MTVADGVRPVSIRAGERTISVRGSSALLGLAFVTLWVMSAWLVGLGESAFEAVLASVSTVVLVTAYVVLRRGILSWFAMFVAVYVLLFLVYPVAASFLGVELPEGDTLSAYTFLTCGGLFFLALGYHVVSPPDLTPDVQDISLRRAGLVALGGIGVLIGVSLLVLSRSGSLAQAVLLSRSSITIEAGGLARVAPFLWVMGSVGIVLAPVVGRRHRLFWPLALALLVPVTFLGFVVFRTRSSVAFVAVALVMGILLAREFDGPGRRPRRRGFGRRGVLILVTFGLMGLIGGSYLRFARGLLEERGLAGLAEVQVVEALRYNLESGDLGFAPVVFDVIEVVPRQRDFLRGQSYLRLLFTPIPRSVWPDKPENTQRVVASWLRPEVEGMTIPPGIQGDLYINFGLAGIVGFLGFGALLGLLDRQRGLPRMLGMGAGFVPIFHLARGGFTNPLLLLAAVLIVAGLIARFVTRSGAEAQRPGIPAAVPGHSEAPS